MRSVDLHSRENEGNYPHWNNDIFSDECSIQHNHNNKVIWFICFKCEIYRRGLVNLQIRGRDISQMIWDLFRRRRRSKSVIVERDKSAWCSEYTANSYVETLEEGLIQICGPRNVFQQYNKAINRAAMEQDFVQSWGLDPRMAFTFIELELALSRTYEIN